MALNNLHIPGYRIVGKLSRRATARSMESVNEPQDVAVYHVLHTESQQPYALKIALSEVGARRVHREIAMLKRISSHPNIVPCLHAGKAPGVGDFPFYVMPLYSQSVYQSIVEHDDAFALSDAIRLMQPLCRAISALHQQAIVHGDIHPNNLMLDEHVTCVLIDFDAAIGIAETRNNGFIYPRRGTHAYASPEQKKGEMPLTAQADIYSLTAVFCALLGGKALCEKLHRAALPEQNTAQYWLHALQPHTNETLFAEISKGLNARPEARHASADALFNGITQGITQKISQGLPDAFLQTFSQTPGESTKQATIQTSENCFESQLSAAHENIQGAQSPLCTVEFEPAVALNQHIKKLKQSLVNYLVMDGEVSQKTRAAVMVDYCLHDNIESPELLIDALINEAYDELKQNTEHAAFFSWTANLRKYALSYGKRLTQDEATKFLQHGAAQGVTDEKRLQHWLEQHFQVRGQRLPSVRKWLLIGAVCVAISAWVYIRVPTNSPVVNMTSPPATTQANRSMIPTTTPNTTPTRTSALQQRAQEWAHGTPSIFAGGSRFAPEKSIGRDGVPFDTAPKLADGGLSGSVVSRGPVTAPHKQNRTNIRYQIKDVKTGDNFTLDFVHFAASSDALASLSDIRPNYDLYVMTEELSQGLWQACVNAGKCRQLSAPSTSPQRKKMFNADHPVVNVNWFDVTEDFIPYLNQALNTRFALPTMSEWLVYSYARPEVPVNAAFIHCKDCSHPLWGEFNETTLPINSLQATPSGLYHVYGNAQEWLQDCWQDVKLGKQRCDQAAAVGGSWLSTKQDIDQQPFIRLLKTARSTTTGFRLVKREKAD